MLSSENNCERLHKKMKQVRLWNRTFEKAQKLCAELGPWAKACESRELCVRGADVIVTATYASEPIVEAEWLTPGVHINGKCKESSILNT